MMAEEYSSAFNELKIVQNELVRDMNCISGEIIEGKANETNA